MRVMAMKNDLTAPKLLGVDITLFLFDMALASQSLFIVKAVFSVRIFFGTLLLYILTPPNASVKTETRGCFYS